MSSYVKYSKQEYQRPEWWLTKPLKDKQRYIQYSNTSYILVRKKQNKEENVYASSCNKQWYHLLSYSCILRLAKGCFHNMFLHVSLHIIWQLLSDPLHITEPDSPQYLSVCQVRWPTCNLSWAMSLINWLRLLSVSTWKTLWAVTHWMWSNKNTYTCTFVRALVLASHFEFPVYLSIPYYFTYTLHE